MDDGDWRIRYLVIDTKNWWPGKKVLISPRLASAIDWADQTVTLAIDRQKVKDSRAYDAAAMASYAYDEKFLSYYGILWVENGPSA
jgi:hypothetical protein